MSTKERMKELSELLRDYQKAYYVDSNPIVSDMEYDRLFDELVELEKANPDLVEIDSPTKRVGSDLTNDFPEFKHSIPVLSLDKAYSRDAVLDFMDKCIKKDGAELSFVGEEKIDGISMVLYYENGMLVRGVTRGNGEIGNDVTDNIRTIHSIPLRLTEPVDIVVRGEVFISKAGFKYYNDNIAPADDKASNARNLAAGSVRRQHSSETARTPLDIFCYEGFWMDKDETPKDHLHIMAKLKALGFNVNPHIAYFTDTKEHAEAALKAVGLNGKGYAFSEMQDYLDEKTKERPTLGYEIDGLVFKINELSTREKFGYTGHHPRWAIAYKFESPQAVTRLNAITLQVGRTGRITPVAELEPVALGGSVISRATLHNQDYIDALELAIGDTVSIVKRGDVIPAVENVEEKNNLGNTTYNMDTKCPCCGHELVKVGAHLFCQNPDCSEQMKQRLAFFTGKEQMDIASFGPKTIALLFDNGFIKTIEDIYSLDYDSDKLHEIPGFGKKTAELLKNGVEDSKNRPFKQVLPSLGIGGLGHKNTTLFIKAGFDSIDKLMAADEQTLMTVAGIGDVTAKTIVNNLHDAETVAEIDRLRAIGLQMAAVDEPSDTVDDSLAGTVWCVTGSFENFNPRSKAMAEIEKRGGRTTGSVTGKTTHLLAGANAGSKLAKAQQLGVTIVSEEDFMNMLGAVHN